MYIKIRMLEYDPPIIKGSGLPCAWRVISLITLTPSHESADLAEMSSTHRGRWNEKSDGGEWYDHTNEEKKRATNVVVNNKNYLKMCKRKLKLSDSNKE